MNSVSLVFPHQLFEKNLSLAKDREIYLVEEKLFFTQFKFHKQKLLFHRASMKFYEKYLTDNNFNVRYIDSLNDLSDSRKLIRYLKKQGISEIHYVDVVDNWLEKRLKKSAETNNVILKVYDSPGFINTKQGNEKFFSGKKKYSQTAFYIEQRKKLNILLSTDVKPEGGKWTYDSENRKKYPVKKVSPKLLFPEQNEFVKEAVKYINKNFSANYGIINKKFIYPTTFDESKYWLDDFLVNRFAEFGPYEDSIVAEESVLHHSLLSPLLNSGLLTPEYVINCALNFTGENSVPINSLEGFIRQIIGWREFVRAIYETEGTKQRTKNYFRFDKKIPYSFWKGGTGIEPIDLTIRKILDTGYCHHIERLMVLGNFMLLCEFDPDDVYKWFMELFIDAYDWAMVPNVYGMSQFADGGLMATKPYISSSNYLMKMGNYKKGDWQNVWDGLFWKFMDKHRKIFLSNPRLGFLIKTFDKMEAKKKQKLLAAAENFLNSL